MLTALIDYESGNLHSALKAFEKISSENSLGSVTITNDPEIISNADRLVLPGDGAFPQRVKPPSKNQRYLRHLNTPF